MDSITISDTEGIRWLANEAVRRKFNRIPSVELLEALDPEGLHVCCFAMPHNDDHVRTIWLVKLEDQEADEVPPQVFLDMTWEAWNGLPVARKEGSAIIIH
jgi:hypothetical protein